MIQFTDEKYFRFCDLKLSGGCSLVEERSFESWNSRSNANSIGYCNLML
jgi:hypothetical protein